MAIRLAILAHHYRQDWDWTDEGLAAAQARLDRWRAAVRRVRWRRLAGRRQSAGDVLGEVRDRLADDLDAPGALAAVDAWADAVLAGPVLASTGPDPGPEAAGLVRDTVDALLGIAL